MDFNNYALDLLEDDQKMETEKNLEFFSDNSCPIEGCPPALVFPTKAKYQRHWTEKYLPEAFH